MKNVTCDFWGMTFGEDMNPCILNSLELIRDKGLPILKKKSLIIRKSKFADVLNVVISL